MPTQTLDHTEQPDPGCACSAWMRCARCYGNLEQEQAREQLDGVAGAVRAAGGQTRAGAARAEAGAVTRLKPAPDDEPMPHWAGNRYLWWQLLAVTGWMRGVVEFPEIGGWRRPRL